MQHCSHVLWVPALGMVGLIGAVEISNYRDKITKTCIEQPSGETIDRDSGGLDEAAPQREIFYRVTGEHHLGEQHEVRTGVGCLLRPVHNKVGVGRDVPDGGVDLGHGNPQMRHGTRLRRDGESELTASERRFQARCASSPEKGCRP